MYLFSVKNFYNGSLSLAKLVLIQDILYRWDYFARCYFPDFFSETVICIQEDYLGYVCMCELVLFPASLLKDFNSSRYYKVEVLGLCICINVCMFACFNNTCMFPYHL